MKEKLEAAMRLGKISAPSVFTVSDTFPLTISITSISPQSGCTPASNALGKRIATGCAKNKTDAVFLSMVEAVERYCIQYSDSRGNLLNPFLSTNSEINNIPQSQICIGSPAYPNNDSIGSAAGNSMEFAAENALLECLEHFHIKNNASEFFELDLHSLPPLEYLVEWLESQYRQLKTQIYESDLGYYIARCVCADFDDGRSTVGTAAAREINVAIFKAAAESIVFWRNMISLENGCVDIDSLNEDEKKAIEEYRGVRKRLPFLADGDLEKNVKKSPRNKRYTLSSLVDHFATLSRSDIGLFDMTDPLLAIPVVKVHKRSS